MKNDIFEMCVNRLFDLEFNSPENALHTNKGEDGYTFMGVYEKYSKSFTALWDLVYSAVDKFHTLEDASCYLYENYNLIEEVKNYYYKNYWINYNLDEIQQPQIALEIFIFGVNANMRTAIKKAQDIVGVEADGYIGPSTLRAFNEYCEEQFDFMFDEEEKVYYSTLAEDKPSLRWALKGWLNRAEAV